jgi:cytochrome c oxidase subunit 4
MHVHQVPGKTFYVAIFLALLGLTALTTGVSYLDFGVFNAPIMLGIAVTKATLVLLFFMELRSSPRLTWVVLAGALVFLLILILGITGDFFGTSNL